MRATLATHPAQLSTVVGSLVISNARPDGAPACGVGPARARCHGGDSHRNSIHVTNSVDFRNAVCVPIVHQDAVVDTVIHHQRYPVSDADPHRKRHAVPDEDADSRTNDVKVVVVVTVGDPDRHDVQLALHVAVPPAVPDRNAVVAIAHRQRNRGGVYIHHSNTE